MEKNGYQNSVMFYEKSHKFMRMRKFTEASASEYKNLQMHFREIYQQPVTCFVAIFKKAFVKRILSHFSYL